MKLRWRTRYTMAAMLASAVFISILDRVNLSIAIIPMSEEFGWDAATKGLILSSFYVGYLFMQIPGGWLADRLGGKLVLGTGVLIWSFFAMFAPPAAYAGITILIIARICLGLCESVTTPAIFSLIPRWYPVHERTRALGVITSTFAGGTVGALLLTPMIVTTFGWQWAFYLFGGAGIVWFVLWQRLATTDPRDHPRISAEELSIYTLDESEGSPRESPSIRVMLRSMPVWSTIVCNFCSSWGSSVMLSWLPLYFFERHGVDFKDVGLASMIPFAASFLFSNIAGFVTDKLISAGYELLFVRKLMNTLAFGGAAIVMTVVGYVDSVVWAIALMTLSSSVGAFGVGGWASNLLDIAPRHVGTLMGIANTAGTLPGIFGVFVSGLILQWTGSWILVFQVAAGMYAFGAVFYLTFANTEQEFG